MTIKEAANKAGVNDMTIRRWIKAGKIRATKTQIGGNWVWLIEDDVPLTPEAPPTPGDNVRDRITRLEQKASLAAQEAEYFKIERDRFASDNARLIEANLKLTETITGITERMAAMIEQQPKASPKRGGLLGWLRGDK